MPIACEGEPLHPVKTCGSVFEEVKSRNGQLEEMPLEATKPEVNFP